MTKIKCNITAIDKKFLDLINQNNWQDACEMLQDGNIRPNVNVQDPDNNFETVFFKAVKQCKLDILKFLIEMDANPNVKDSLGWYPLHYAVSNLCSDQYLELNAKSVDNCEIDLLKSTKLNIIDFLCRNGADINAIEPESGCTYLHFAAGSNEVELVEILLQYFASIKIKDNKDKYAIEYCNNQKIMDLICNRTRIEIDEVIIKFDDEFKSLYEIIAINAILENNSEQNEILQTGISNKEAET